MNMVDLQCSVLHFVSPLKNRYVFDMLVSHTSSRRS